MVEHFVMASGDKKDKLNSFSLIQADNARQAHEFLVAHHRKELKLAPNVHISTQILHRTTDEVEANYFYRRLMEEIKAAGGKE